MQPSPVASVQQPLNARGRRTRAALLAAARALLEEAGFAALSMAAVAERAGVTRRAVYLHFASRGDLVGAVFEAVAETEGLTERVAAIRAAPNALDAVDAWARLEATYHARILDVAHALEHIDRDDPEAAAWRERVTTFQLDLCQYVVQRLEVEARLAPGWTARTAADMLWALMSTEPIERLLRDRRWPPELYARQLAQLLNATFVAASPTLTPERVPFTSELR
jgi:AcrR family transcriptional regulator